MWRELLERRDHREAQRMLQESQLSYSGLLLRVGVYRRCPQLPATGSPCTTSAESGCWSPQLVRTFPDADLELIKQVWDRNADQVSPTPQLSQCLCVEVIQLRAYKNVWQCARK
jgi:hypothetical protein